MVAVASGSAEAGRADQPRLFPRICYRVSDALAGAGRRDAMRRYERACRGADGTTRKTADLAQFAAGLYGRPRRSRMADLASGPIAPLAGRCLGVGQDPADRGGQDRAAILA